jgi:GDP/UDP-N,N'-diacetylbacillosamine 2-epimerase (hydrolysing)
MRIAILTTARSDFGLLKRVIHLAAERFGVDLLVAGSHFLRSRGETVQDVEREFGGHATVRVTRFAAMQEDISTPHAQIGAIAATQLAASRWFEENACELLLFLGDRWELWGVTLPAFLHGIPLAHISGGEVTEGVIDDSVRHSHTKLSCLHFAAAGVYAHNISRMGEEDWRINVVGECGLDAIHSGDIATAEEVRERFGIDLGRDTLVAAFHPSTLDLDLPVEAQVGSLLEALSRFPDHQIVFTAPGVELGGDAVLSALRQFVAGHPNAHLVEHLSSRYYLAALGASKLAVGNSSSGIVEAASLGVPAVNVGQRQKNRLAADCVQHVRCDAAEIEAAVRRALSGPYQEFARQCANPYDPFRDGKNSRRIVDAVERSLTAMPRTQLKVKKFDTDVHPEQWNALLNNATP